MTTKSEMFEMREAAGARYLAAVAELKDSYVELAAFDLALSNRHHGSPDDVKTFDGSQAQQGVPDGLIHPHFCKRGDVDGGWHKDVSAKADEHLAALQSEAA